ncbi:MAG: zinc-dependent metalloprotease, partial [Pseudomonadota bacterium]
VGGAHPYGSLWDNGSDPLASLDNVLAVRQAALAQFGLRSLAPDQSVSDLQTVFAPIYLYHRYQVLAAAKLVGGYEFDYGRVSDPAAPVTPVPDQRQRQAVMSVLRTLAPDTLRIPVRIQRLMSPPIDRWEPVLGRERIGSRVDPVFDPQQAAGAAATLSLSALLHPQRLGRVALAHANDGQRLSVPELLRQTVAVAFDGNVRPGLDGENQLAVQQALIDQLIRLDGDTGAAISVRAAARASLLDIAAQLRSRARAAQPATTRAWLADQVGQYLENGRLPEALGVSTADTPPGSPIGADSCWHCDSASLLR